MKYIIYLLLLYQINVYSQTYELTYVVTEIKDYEISDKFDERQRRVMNRYLNDIKDFASNFKLKLLADSNHYYYRIESRMPLESMSQEYKQVTTISRMGLSQNLLFTGNEVYYYNNTDKFITKSDLNLLKWNITKNERIINDFKCSKIEPIYLTDYNLGYNSVGLEGWFTSQINIKGGPTPYGNIPGLIVVLENQFVKYELIDINVSEKQIPTVSDFTEGYKVLSFEDAQKYHKRVGEMIKNDK